MSSVLLNQFIIQGAGGCFLTESLQGRVAVAESPSLGGIRRHVDVVPRDMV